MYPEGSRKHPAFRSCFLHAECDSHDEAEGLYCLCSPTLPASAHRCSCRWACKQLPSDAPSWQLPEGDMFPFSYTSAFPHTKDSTYNKTKASNSISRHEMTQLYVSSRICSKGPCLLLFFWLHDSQAGKPIPNFSIARFCTSFVMTLLQKGSQWTALNIGRKPLLLKSGLFLLSEPMLRILNCYVAGHNRNSQATGEHGPDCRSARTYETISHCRIRRCAWSSQADEGTLPAFKVEKPP